MNTGCWRDDALVEKFLALSQVLQSHQHWWRPRAFMASHLPWEAAHPELAATLRAMPLAESETLAANDLLLANYLARWIPAAKSLPELCDVPKAPTEMPADAAASRREPAAVPGRKWQQIQAFVDSLAVTDLPAVEWCSGKAHLGRWYAQCGGARVDALEWNGELVIAGNQLAQREHASVQVHHVDVLSPAAKNTLHGFLNHGRQMLALHACGQLHIQLLHLCAQEKDATAIALAPCCYQLIPQDQYQPLSALARAANMPLTKLDLHTAVQESVTSPERVSKQRRQLQAWRLGFDVLQREVRGVDEYLHTPSAPLSILPAGFQVFCERMAVGKGVELPPGIPFAAYEQQGMQRFSEVNALDLPRLLFRRVLELWLVLDRAVYLRESGYRVNVSTFCERALTPRNLLMQAHRH